MSDPSERTIYVKNLDDRVDKEILEELFVQVGNVVSVFIKEHATPENPSQQQNIQPAKYAFVEFQDEESVLYAIEMLNQVELFGRQLMIAPRDKTQKADQFRSLQQKRNSNSSAGQDRRSYAGQAVASSSHRKHPYLDNDRSRRYASNEELYSGSVPSLASLKKSSLSPLIIPPKSFEMPNSYSSIESSKSTSLEQNENFRNPISTPINHRNNAYRYGKR